MARQFGTRARRRRKKSNVDKVQEFVAARLKGLAGPFASAADPSMNMASKSGAFIPDRALASSGKNANKIRDAASARTVTGYNQASMGAAGGLTAAALAAASLRRPGAAAARLATTAGKTGKKAGTSTVKKTTKKAAAKKTTKKTTVKKTTPPVKPKSVIEKQRARDKAKMDKVDSKKKGPQPQPKPENIKTDGPGGSTSPGFKPKRKPKYKPEPTTARPSSPAKSGEARTTPMSTKEVEDTLGKLGFKRSETGLEGAYKRYKGKGLDKPKVKRTKGVTKKTPIAREKSESQVARRKKAGGNRAVEDAINNPKLGGNRAVSGMTPAQLKKALANPRSAQSRLLRQLEKRAKRRNLREGEKQLLERLRDNAPKATNPRKTEGLMRDGIRSVGQGQAEGGSRAGFVNPPRNVKASNQKWRGEGGKDAPKSPTGGGAKRGEKITERTGAEDGVTRNKGTGGQKRRVIKPSTDVAVSRGGPRGQRVGGGSSSGRKPIALGSGRKAPSKDVVKGEVVRGGRNNSGSSSGGTKGRTRREPIDLKTRPRGSKAGAAGSGPRAIGGRKGKEVAVRGAGTVATRNQAAAAGAKKKSKSGALLGASAVGAVAGAAALATQLGEKAKETAPAAATDTTAAPATKLKDKYGRRISREEFNKREAFRKRVAKMTPDQAKRARKKEMKRREQYRKTEGKKNFGKESKTVTRNKELAEGVSSRYVNAKLKRATTEAERKAIRKKYKRKNKK